MKVEKEVTIYVESFIDALEIVDKMDDSLPHSVIFMNEEEFFEGKCHVVIGKTMFIFLPVVQKYAGGMIYATNNEEALKIAKNLVKDIEDYINMKKEEKK